MAGAWCWGHIYRKMKGIIWANAVRSHAHGETRDRRLPAALWWSCADRAALWTGGNGGAWRPRPALRTERRMYTSGSCCCWEETPAGPGTSDTMPRKEEESGWQETRQRKWRLFNAGKMLLKEGIHLSFSLRLLRRAVPLDGDQQIRLIDLLTQRSCESIKPGAPKVKFFDNLSAY